LAVEKVKPDPLNLTANTVVGSVVEVFKALACRASAFFASIQGLKKGETKIKYWRGDCIGS